MNILVIGSGGREHTFVWKLKQSPKCDQLFVAPGNAGTAQIATNVDLGVNDFEGIGNYALENQIELIVVGPEEPLVKGIVNYFQNEAKLSDIKIIGPDQAGAQLEGSKDFSKEFMQKYGIPTAAYKTFKQDELQEGLAYLEQIKAPYVLKADGLAAGKGVIISEDINEAKASLTEMLQDLKFGAASSKVVIEEFLSGIELSVFVITDGNNYVLLPEAKDYKRIGEGDTGLNTGGMGALTPVPFADKEFLDKVEERVIKPTLEGLKSEGIDYTGFIFFGLMNVDGNPEVIEYNVRMGDPETEVVIPRLNSDLVDIFEAAANKKLGEISIDISEEAASTVVLVAGGYPEAYEKGKVISGLEDIEGVIPFHAGTKLDGDNVVTNGGRVIAMTALGPDLQSALQKSKMAAEKVAWEDRYYRTDIGFDLLETAKN